MSRCGQGSVVCIAIGYGLKGSGIKSRWGARFSAPVQTGPGAHPTNSKMDTGSFLGVKSGRGVTLTPHPLLVPWSWLSRHPSAPAVFTPSNILVLIFRVDPRAHGTLWCPGKNPQWPGIDPGTLRLVAQCLNLYATRGPSYVYYLQKSFILFCY